MKQNLLFTGLVMLFISCLTTLHAQPIIANHEHIHRTDIPTAWIEAAKSELRIWYGHTSHGSQITTGMNNLHGHVGDLFGYNSAGSSGFLSYQEVYGDLGHNGDLGWEVMTREQLNDPANDRNVVMWSWCGGVSDNTVQGINIYLNAMNQLELDFPDVQFVYMTGHRDIWADANLKARNQQIRDYCLAYDKILFDFADIESYDPIGSYYEYAHDNCDFYDANLNLLGNWASEYCSQYPGSEYCWDCYCSHSEAANCNMKGAAAWWMYAKMAGWNDTQSLIIPEGWSGISTCFVPANTSIEDMFAPVLDDLVILHNSTGVFWPEMDINTLGNWDYTSGYLIKLSADVNLTLEGSEVENKTIALQQGWNLMPVLCAEGMMCSDILLQLGDDLLIITEPAGTNVFWPQMNIQTLTALQPGKSYYIKTTTTTMLTFP
ncbi:MAG: hypothetical protein WC271_08860 [Bacteroidales bacterium]|jgi:hypothetical protein|nr:hypothetical protein [Bacteroidales bacterium]MDY0201922.1 hypothetical protein [Tenuifilaceae bacterium]